ncbi:hypothetical protein L6452_23030 [Arctium lappa]|uniref:Uncharacterized protein n=1 Tax=Arctium lappa TaxID=4217 RepID=A0ACB9B1B8_ARCLA|nr:hypothetical protein L6452_23030 [Arctium lappa]
MDELENSSGSEYDSEYSEGEDNNGQGDNDTISDEEFEEDRGDPKEDRGDPEEDIGDQNEEIGDQHEEIGNVAKKKTRGLTRLVKLRKDFEDSKGKRRVVEFDQWGRFTGKYRAEFSSYLGDLARHAVGLRFLKWKKVTKELKDMLWDSITLYYEIDVSRRKQMMCHLAERLRDFRRKLYTKYIQPNIGKPRKLRVVPKPYKGFVQQKHWDAFVEWRLSPEFKDVSTAAKQARAKVKYPHRLGRSGYTGLREKLVKNKELAEDEVPERSFMWRKARESKDGEYKDDDVRNVANEITCHEKEIAEGSIKLDEGTDALTLVFGKDHNGRVRGVGKGVTK